MTHRRLSSPVAGLAAGAALAALLVTGVQAQSQAGTDRRFDRIERDLRTLQSIVMQAQATGQPVQVRPEGPDPAVTAMQQRMDDLELTLQRINSQVETLGHDLDQARRNDAAAEAERGAQAKLLNDRLARIETQIAVLGQSASASDPSLGPPPGTLGADATARAQAQDRGVLGAPPPPPPPPPPTPLETFNAARALYASGDTNGAADAFQDFVSRYPANARTPEAYYWLGESFYAQKGYQNAVAAYANALRTRPTTTWASAAMVRLSQALTQSDQAAQACAALTEFDKRYAAKASAAVKANAEAVRRRARCP